MPNTPKEEMTGEEFSAAIRKLMQEHPEMHRDNMTPAEKASSKQMAQEFVDNLNRNVAREQSVLNAFVRDAVSLAIQTHEIDQKQKRKGKDIPYIVHPLTVGLILAKAGAGDHIIAAGILHDTIEDSVPEKKVTRQMLAERFSPSVADIVDDVTEKNKALSWKNRKLEALKHIKTMDGPSLWVKTADTISNVSELVEDYSKDGDRVFERFNASKSDIITNYRAVIDALINRWGTLSENDMRLDLRTLADDLIILANK